MAFQYKPTATGLAFHNSNKFLKCLVGCFGSGKTCAMACETLFNAAAQKPAPDGVRYVRVGVCRSSYPELKSATRRSLLEVLPAECGFINAEGSPIKGSYNIPLPDGTRIQLELELWAIQSEDDNEKIKSCNWTFAVINEATGCSPTIVPAVMSRVGRFPPPALGGVTWGGILMDTNQPAPGSWLADLIEHPQDNWDVFIQPPAAFKKEDAQGNTVYEINPDAENLENLGAFQPDDPPDFTAQQKGMRYYRNQIEALAKLGRYDLIDNQFCLLPVPVIDGKPVYPQFDRALHIARHELKPEPLREIWIGIDTSGLHPAAVIIQQQKDRWCVLDELYAEEGFELFLHGVLVPHLRSKYPSNPIRCAVDPADARDSWQGITPSERLAEVGIKAVTQITNSPKARIQAVEHMLNLHVGGLLISPNCEMLIRGFEGEYKYRRLRTGGSGGAAYTPQPDKTSETSHPHDGLQYCVLLINMRESQKADENYRAASEAIKRHRQKLARIV